MRTVRGGTANVVLALTLVWSLFPGTRELTEQVVHLVRNGHLAHSIPNDPDACPTDAEHGCEGPMHLCQCCQTVPLLAPTGLASITKPAPTRTLAGASSALHDDPHLDGVFHPPKA